MLCLCALLFSGVQDPIFGAKRGQISTRVARHIRVYLFMSGLSNFKAQTLTAQILRDVRIYYSLKYLSLSEVTVLIFLAPFMTAILGVVILGERIGVGQGLAGCE